MRGQIVTEDQPADRKACEYDDMIFWCGPEPRRWPLQVLSPWCSIHRGYLPSLPCYVNAGALRDRLRQDEWTNDLIHWLKVHRSNTVQVAQGDHHNNVLRRAGTLAAWSLAAIS